MNQRGAVVVLGLLVGGCSAPGALPESPEMVVVAEGLATTLEVEIGASEVHLILHVTNPTSRAIRLEFPTAQRYDFFGSIRRHGGVAVVGGPHVYTSCRHRNGGGRRVTQV